MTDEARYLGSGTQQSDRSSLTGEIPSHLPPRLTISLWDFSWYTRAGVGEPYADLDAVCADAASLGYNAIRICAAPLLLFGDLGLDDLAYDLRIQGMGPALSGGYFGQRTRWYDTPGGYSVDLHQRLFDLLDAARRHGLVVAFASWEYQQSPAFAESPRWFEAIDAVPLADRYALLAASCDRMIDAISDAGHRDTIALVELHNEVDFSILPALSDGGIHQVDWLRSRHQDLLITASYGKPPHLAMHEVPSGLGVGQFHVYSYGVLDELQKLLDIRSEGNDDFPNAALAAMLLDGAPSLEEYGRALPWKYRATVVTDQMFYGYDWIDPVKWDEYLVAHYARFDEVMKREIESRVIAVASWARWQGIPVVVGEGWVGYTPLNGTFEEGPIGLALAEHGIRTALANGVWGVVLCSNAAPHHPMWSNREWQKRLNTEILESPVH